MSRFCQRNPTQKRKPRKQNSNGDNYRLMLFVYPDHKGWKDCHIVFLSLQNRDLIALGCLLEYLSGIKIGPFSLIQRLGSIKSINQNTSCPRFSMTERMRRKLSLSAGESCNIPVTGLTCRHVLLFMFANNWIIVIHRQLRQFFTFQHVAPECSLPMILSDR